jgi:hypothetical protein
MAAKTSKAEMLDTLKSLVQDMLRLRHEGANHGQFGRAHGYVDGYIRVMLDAGIASERELLDLVLEERNRQTRGLRPVEDEAVDVPQVA